MGEVNSSMDNWLEERAGRLREELRLAPDAKLLAPEATEPELTQVMSEHLARFNIEWHIIPSNEVAPLDDEYITRFYRMAPRGFAQPREHAPSYRDALIKGHRKHQGQVVGVETTQKPRYLPGNRQFYGTSYGFDASADPFSLYIGRAGMTNATRYAHNYISLREFVRVVNDDW